MHMELKCHKLIEAYNIIIYALLCENSKKISDATKYITYIQIHTHNMYTMYMSHIINNNSVLIFFHKI